MRFVVDECIGPTVAHWLAAMGHDVLSIYDTARGAEDDFDDEKAVSLAKTALKKHEPDKSGRVRPLSLKEISAICRAVGLRGYNYTPTDGGGVGDTLKMRYLLREHKLHPAKGATGDARRVLT